MTDSIIVYRNPLEKAMWESPVIVPIGCWIVVFFVLLILFLHGAERICRKIGFGMFSWQYQLSTYIAGGLAGIAAFNIVKYLF